MTDRWHQAEWLQTYTGLAFCPLDPDPATVCREDIAHALGLICRFGGHSSRFYSVAEHSVLVSRALERDGASLEVVRWGLMHDAAEAYVGDMVRPLKRGLPAYCAVENEVLAAIRCRFDLAARGAQPEVKVADQRILLDERAALLTRPPRSWEQDGLEPLGVVIDGWPPPAAEIMFLQRMQDLGL